MNGCKKTILANKYVMKTVDTVSAVEETEGCGPLAHKEPYLKVNVGEDVERNVGGVFKALEIQGGPQ